MPAVPDTTAVREAEVVILGAGPQALGLASALLESQPYVLDDNVALASRRRGGSRRAPGQGPACKASDILVVDPAGAWIDGWRKAFAYFEIPTLRSHMLAHPDPRTELALLDADKAAKTAPCHGNCGSPAAPAFDGLDDQQEQEQQEEEDEEDDAGTAIDVLRWNHRLMRRGKEDASGKRKRRGPRRSPSATIRPFLQDHGFLFARPSIGAFLGLCDSLVDRYRLADRLVAGKAASLTRTGPSHVLVGLADGSAIRAKRVVCCLGPTGQLRIPAWAAPYRKPAANLQEAHGGGILHSHELPSLGLSHADLYRGRDVLVVGGGLTSAHLVLSAHRHGAASVTWLVRRPIRLQEFCFDIEWAGRGRHRLISDYRALPLAERLQSLKESRPGGTITPVVMARLRKLMKGDGAGRVRLIEGAEVQTLRQDAGKGWAVTLSTGERLPHPVDRILLATGVEVDVRRDPLLAPLLDDMVAHGGAGSAESIAHGLPLPDPSLRLPVAGMEVYTMGPYAALQVGPDAANLAGAMTASRIIADEIRERMQQHQQDQDREPDFFEDIHELNNPFDALEAAWSDSDEEEEVEDEEAN